MPRFLRANPAEINAQVNPFVNDLVIKIRRTVPKNLFRVVGTEKGKPVYEKVDKEYLKEQGELTKIYTNPLARIKKAQLTGRAAHLLNWISDELVDGQDWISINVKRYIKESEKVDPITQKTIRLSLNTYKEAINDLRIAGIIMPTTAHETYFINPSILFKGSRPNKYKSRIEYI